MLSLPLYFRVAELHATEDGDHRALLREMRRPLLMEAPPSTGPRMPRQPDAPPCAISVPVTPDQFARLRVGMDLDLTELGTAQGPISALDIRQQQANPGQRYGG